MGLGVKFAFKKFPGPIWNFFIAAMVKVFARFEADLLNRDLGIENGFACACVFRHRSCKKKRSYW